MRAAAFCATRNMYPDIAPPVKALLSHSDVEKIYILAEDDEVGVWLPGLCEIVNVSGQSIFPQSSPNYENPWSWIVLMRAAYFRLFPDLDRILSLDLDAFCLRRDVSTLWRLPMEHKLLAGVRETSDLSTADFPYYNAGVLVQNLDLLRRSGAGDEVIRALNRRRFQYPEQDALNLVCSGAILELPPEYNAGRGTAPYGAPVIRHFMGEQKTFRKSEICRQFREMSWEEATACRW